ncbi:hypothetical protein V496_03971 [Pseudogymnoascus sp. VKM F-4515 (FW-2607)]|nr:hypothetical protein V496_03971 [Pseudogymnoascus sp. VKM F-4515 (FW-2607)]
MTARAAPIPSLPSPRRHHHATTAGKDIRWARADRFPARYQRLAPALPRQPRLRNTTRSQRQISVACVACHTGPAAQVRDMTATMGWAAGEYATGDASPHVECRSLLCRGEA